MRVASKPTKPPVIQAWSVTTLLTAVTAAVLVVYAPAWAPMGRDDGVFAYIGQQLLLGAVPYRDIWDHKPPGIYVVDAVALAIGGRWGIWAVSGAVASATVALATAVLCSVFGSRYGLLCGALHAIVMVDPRLYQENGNVTELYGLSLQWVTLWRLSRLPRHPTRNLVLAGAAMGASIVFKPTTAAIAVAVLLYLVGTSTVTHKCRHLTAFLGGSLAIPTVAVACLGSSGVLAEAYDCVLLYNRAYVTPHLLRALAYAAYLCLRQSPMNLLAAPAFASVVLPGWRFATPSPVVRIALIALPIELLLLALSGRFYGHYFLTLIAILAVRTGAFLPAMMSRVPLLRRHRNILATAALSALVFQLGVHLFQERTRQQAQQAWQTEAVSEVMQRTGPQDRILVWGAEVGLNFLTARKAPSLYSYAFPLFTPGYTTTATWQRFLSDLQHHPPALILDASARPSWPTPLASIEAIVTEQTTLVPLPQRPGLSSFLRQYRKETTPGGIELWVRTPSS